jgi:hypothetical protein
LLAPPSARRVSPDPSPFFLLSSIMSELQVFSFGLGTSPDYKLVGHSHEGETQPMPVVITPPDGAKDGTAPAPAVAPATSDSQTKPTAQAPKPRESSTQR